MKYIVPAVSGLILSGCVNGLSVGPSVNETAGVSADPNLVRPLARPATLDTTPAPPPPPTARTVEQFDTTTAEDRAEAVAEAELAGETRLGSTIASLGSPADPGFWLKTPFVTELAMGRVEYPANGKSVNVELRPSGGEAGSGSQLSLPAMRLLEAPLTGLPEVIVYKN